MVFSLPGYGLIALAAVLAAVTFRRLRSRGDFFCLCASGVFFGYILLRSLTSPIVYAARPDLYCVLAALAVYGVTILLSNATLRLTIIVSLLALAIVHVLIGIVQFTRGDNFMLIPFLQRANYGVSCERIFCLSQSSCRIVGGIGSFWIEHRLLEPLAALVEIARGLSRRRLLCRRSAYGRAAVDI